MDSEVKLFAKIRGLITDLINPTDDEETMVHLTPHGEQIYAQAAPSYSEISRQGRSFWINTAAQVPCVIAMPTTAQGFSLYNNEPDGGRSYIIDRVWALFTAVPATLCQATVIGCLGQVREAVPTNAMSATVVLKKNNATQGFDTRARVILTATALPATTGFAGNWMPLGRMVNAGVTTLPGFMQVYDLDGRFIVPPGRYFALHGLANAITVNAQLGIAWTEKYLNIG